MDMGIAWLQSADWYIIKDGDTPEMATPKHHIKLDEL